LDRILIDPLPPYVWCQDVADFADGISDRAAGEGPCTALCRARARSGVSSTSFTSAIPT